MHGRPTQATTPAKPTEDEAERLSGRARRRFPPGLVVLLAIAALESVTWALVLPALQGPDESAHIAATVRLIEHGQLRPPRGEPSGALPRDLVALAAQGNLGSLVGILQARPSWSALDERTWARVDKELGDRAHELTLPAEGPPTQGTSRNPPLYAIYTALPYAIGKAGSLLDRLALMRLANALLLLVTVAATWYLAAELLPGRRLAPPLAAGVVALHPELAFFSGTVNPDNLLVALVSVACLVAVRLVRRGPTLWRLIALAAVVCAAFLTHFRGAALVPFAALAVGLAIRWGSLHGRRRSAALAGVVLGAAGLLAAYLALALLLDVSASGTSANAPSGLPLREFGSYVWQFYLPGLPSMRAPLGGDYGVREVYVETLHGTFASLEVRFPRWVFDVLAVCSLVAVAGLIVALVARRGSVRRRWRELALLAALPIVMLIGLHVVAFRQLRVDPSDPIIVGRYLLPLIAPTTVALAFAVTTLPRRAASHVAAFLIVGVALLQVGALGMTFARFYG